LLRTLGTPPGENKDTSELLLEPTNAVSQTTLSPPYNEKKIDSLKQFNIKLKNYMIL